MAGQVNEWIDKNTRSLIMVSKQPGIQSMEKDSRTKSSNPFRKNFLVSILSSQLINQAIIFQGQIMARLRTTLTEVISKK